jgi:hypothetical protein
MLMRNLRTTALCALATLSAIAVAQDAALTPAGAERSASKDGTIPAWEGAPPAGGWTYGKKRIDSFKYKDDKPLFTIDASNVDKYLDKLAPGQVAAVKQMAGFKMAVYPSRRTCGIPDFVVDNTKKNTGTAKLGPDGWSLKEATLPGFPFPAPKTGAEAMWNSKMRYRGVGIDYPQVITAVSPRKGSTEWIKAESEQTVFFPWAAKGSNQISALPPVEQNVYFSYRAPTALAGGSLAITIFLDQPATETFYYFPGQRRVRRMPSYAYDSPQVGFENQYTLDEPYVFQGTIDRFDWKLVGKKEILVPYNAYGAYDFSGKFEDLVKPEGLLPSHRRYELHRVWVVEATVKAGARHIAPKRTFYLDEDSWSPLLAEDYDGQGKLFKLREGYVIPVYETGTCDVSAFSQYNLTEGRVVFDLSPVGTGKDMKWAVDASSSPRFKSSFYTADNLRAVSER